MLIGPGLALTAVGMLLMRGLDASTSWTHLIPGFTVAGIGVGMVNPPLASTAVGVVPPRLAGMASGVNSTSRQVGIATGIALLGTLFASRLESAVTSATTGTAFEGRGESLAAPVQSGQLKTALTKLPKEQIPVVEQIAATGFTSALNSILLIAAIVALIAGAAAFALIRTKDSHTDDDEHGAQPSGEPSSEPEAKVAAAVRPRRGPAHDRLGPWTSRVSRAR